QPVEQQRYQRHGASPGRAAGALRGDSRNHVERNVADLAVDLLRLAEIEVLDEVAGLGIHLDRAARAGELAALRESDERIRIEGLAFLRLEPLVDDVDRIP